MNATNVEARADLSVLEDGLTIIGEVLDLGQDHLVQGISVGGPGQGLVDIREVHYHSNLLLHHQFLPHHHGRHQVLHQSLLRLQKAQWFREHIMKPLTMTSTWLHTTHMATVT